MEKTINFIITLFGGLITFFTPIWYKKYKASKNINNFRKHLNIDEEIKLILRELRAKFGFHRVSIQDFHNGTSSFSGFSFKNTSMRYEDCDSNTKSIIKEYQNIPCSIINDMLIRLEKSSLGYIVATDDINYTLNEDTVITHKMYGITQAYNFRIGNSLIYGALTLSLTNGRITLSEEDILDIKAAIQKIFLLKNNK